MNVHEYQGKEILKQYGVDVPRGQVAFTPEEAVEAAKALGGDLWVVKAQIHAGGRGKAGGVKLARSLDEVRAHAEELLGKVLVTHQTGPEGKEVKRLLIEEGCKIEKEYYVGMVIDRSTGRVTLMASEEGGTEIEEVAARTPEKIIKEVDRPGGRPVALPGAQARLQDQHSQGSRQQGGPVHDGTVPRVRGEGLLHGGNQPARRHRDGQVMALDAKLNFDGNALYRHPDISRTAGFGRRGPRRKSRLPNTI